jgi:serine protease Do
VLSLTPEAAVIATDVIAGGPADRAGMQTGDALLEYRGHKVTSVDALAELIAQTPVGVLAPVTIWRKGEVRQLLIPIEERPRGLLDDPSLRPSLPALSPRGAGSTAPSPMTRIGLRVMDLTEQLADFFGVRQERGVLVLEVTPDGPAAHAGVHAGDVIIGIGPMPVRNRSDMLRALGALPAGTVMLRVIRRRQPLVFTLRLR